jgi:hypothetical protein
MESTPVHSDGSPASPNQPDHIRKQIRAGIAAGNIWRNRRATREQWLAINHQFGAVSEVDAAILDGSGDSKEPAAAATFVRWFNPLADSQDVEIFWRENAEGQASPSASFVYGFAWSSSADLPKHDGPIYVIRSVTSGTETLHCDGRSHGLKEGPQGLVVHRSQEAAESEAESLRARHVKARVDGHGIGELPALFTKSGKKGIWWGGTISGVFLTQDYFDDLILLSTY